MALSRGDWSTYHVEIASLEYTAMLYYVANTASSATSVFCIAFIGKVPDVSGGTGEAMAWVVAMGVVGATCGACGVFFLAFAEVDKMLFPSVEPRHEALFSPAVPRAGGDFETV